MTIKEDLCDNENCSMKKKSLPFTIYRLLFPHSRLARGFTLIEVLLVVSIITVLSTIGGYAWREVSHRAQANKILHDLKEIEGAWLLWRADTHHQYPKESEYPKNPPGYCDDEPLQEDTNLFNNHILDDETVPNPLWQGPYLTQNPLDPWGRQYAYDNDEDPSGVFIFLTYQPADAGRYAAIITILDHIIDNDDGNAGRFQFYLTATCGGMAYRIAPGKATY